MPEEIRKKEIDKLKRVLHNGSPEWLVLRLMVENRGNLGNAIIYRSVDKEFQRTLSKPVLSRARRHLEKNGLQAIRSFNSISYQLPYELEEQYRKLFSIVDEINRILDEGKDKSDLQRLVKNGKVKQVKT